MILTAFPVGFFAGLFGIGGGLITVPFLFFIFDYDFLIRLNADNPFVSKKVIRKNLRETIQGNYDVSTYAFSNSIPFGLSAVIFKKKI